MEASRGIEDYVLAQGEGAVNRLLLLQSIYGPATMNFLIAAGLREGMRVVEFGCGVGTTTLEIAQLVGPKGQVTGLDTSVAQLAIAQRSAKAAGLDRISWRNARAQDSGLPAGVFDLAYCRFLLCHTPEPSRVLSEMKRLLRPGGVLACEDLECSTLTTNPTTSIYSEMAHQAVSHGVRRNIDSDVGARLPFLLRNVGMTNVRVNLWQPAYFEGPEKHFWEDTMREATPGIASMGLAPRDEMERKLAGMRAVNEDPSILLLLPRQWQVWGLCRDRAGLV